MHVQLITMCHNIMCTLYAYQYIHVDLWATVLYYSHGNVVNRNEEKN